MGPTPLPTQAEKDAKPEVYGKWGDLFELPNVPVHASPAADRQGPLLGSAWLPQGQT